MRKSFRIVYIDIDIKGNVTARFSNTKRSSSYISHIHSIYALPALESYDMDARGRKSKESWILYRSYRDDDTMRKILKFLHPIGAGVAVWGSAARIGATNPYASWLRYPGSWGDSSAIKGNVALVTRVSNA